MLDLNNLKSETRKVFECLAASSFLRPYTLIGGTALAMQIGHRQSEDLDFCIWRSGETKPFLSISSDALLNDLRPLASHLRAHLEVLMLLPNQLDILFNSVKLTFFADNENLPVENTIRFNENIRIAHRDAIAAMKVGVMFNRQTFRDFYDLYAISQSGFSVSDIISEALKFKPYLNAKLITLLLTYPELHLQEDIRYLNPRYAVTVQMIADFFKAEVRKMNAAHPE
jgi:predicted nucleotidyltransferase component of viral defense system